MEVRRRVHGRHDAFCNARAGDMYLEDLTGEPFDPDEVVKARRLEIEDFKQMGMDKKVLSSEARQRVSAVLGMR